MDLSFIDTNTALAQVCEQMASASAICIDTEFHRETTYFPELALIQLSDGSTTCCIDPLAINDFDPFLKLLKNPAITKVLHASQQDLEIFQHQFNTLPTPVFDTQIAAGLLGYGDQIGYAGLMQKVLNVSLDKSQSRTDWLKRPLSEAQLSYAANDVYYLAQAYPIMVSSLSDKQRLNWLDDDFAELEKPENYSVDRQLIWKKTKGNQKLKGQQLAVLQAISGWRETAAEKRNRPRRRILPDEALIDIARLQPASIDKLLKLRSLSKTRLDRADAESLLEAMKDGLELPRDAWPKHPKRVRLSAAEEALVDALHALLRLKADEHDITPLNLASRKDLEKLIQGERDIPLLHGWRYSHAGQAIEQFFKGDGQLGVKSGKLTTS